LPSGPKIVSVPSKRGEGFYIRVWSPAGDTRPGYGLRITRTGPAAVVQRQPAYKNSALDGHDATPGVVADGAVDFSREVAYTPWFDASPRFATGYDKGINAIVVDVSGLPAGETLSASDFDFRVGTSGDPATWRAAPAPSGVTVRRGAGFLGTDRVAITWPDRSITNTWLQVTMKPTAATGLDVPDVFRFGNLVGDTGDYNLRRPSFWYRAEVDAWDLVGVRRHFTADTGPDAVTNPYDINHDGAINQSDLLLAQRNVRRSLGQVAPLEPPAIAATPARSPARSRPVTRAAFGETSILA
jgi:hypothetical protein